VLTTAAELPYAGVVTAFQPAGRTPAPAPLDLLQDFVNTEIPEWAQDDIGSPAALADWLAGRGLLEPGADVTAEDFLRTRAFRSWLRTLALANTTGLPPATEERDALMAELGRLVFVLELGPGGEPSVAAAGDGIDRALAGLASIAVSAAQDGTWSRFKACRKASCGWIFYDRSRNKSSNWCSMTICGNRAKTADYRRRRVSS
jgi:predicted RNA-binding Zn ribbon-like protein